MAMGSRIMAICLPARAERQQNMMKDGCLILLVIFIAAPFIIAAIPALLGMAIGAILFLLFCGLVNLILDFLS
jgi:hypothetical protein